MFTQNLYSSRRALLKNFGIAAVSPLLLPSALAQNNEAEITKETAHRIICSNIRVDLTNAVIKIIKENGWADSYAAIHGSCFPWAKVCRAAGENDG